MYAETLADAGGMVSWLLRGMGMISWRRRRRMGRRQWGVMGMVRRKRGWSRGCRRRCSMRSFRRRCRKLRLMVFRD